MDPVNLWGLSPATWEVSGMAGVSDSVGAGATTEGRTTGGTLEDGLFNGRWKGFMSIDGTSVDGQTHSGLRGLRYRGRFDRHVFRKAGHSLHRRSLLRLSGLCGTGRRGSDCRDRRCRDDR